MHVYTHSRIYICVYAYIHKLSLSLYTETHIQKNMHVNLDIHVCTHIYEYSHLYMESIYKYTNIPILCEHYSIMYMIKPVCAKTQDRERDVCMCVCLFEFVFVCVCVCVFVYVVFSSLSFMYVFEYLFLHVLMTSATITPECLVLPQQWW